MASIIRETTEPGVLPIAARKNRIAWLILKEGRLLGSAAEPTDAKRAQTSTNGCSLFKGQQPKAGRLAPAGFTSLAQGGSPENRDAQTYFPREGYS